MATIAEKLSYVNTTKQLIKAMIIDKGVSVADDLPFRDYPERISRIGFKNPVKYEPTHITYFDLLEVSSQ